MGVLQRARNLLPRRKSTEPRDSIPPSWPIEWFQMGRSPTVISSTCGVVEACVSAYAQTIAQCPIRHYRIDENGVKTVLTNTVAHRLLNKPNSVQTRSDLNLNLVNSILKQGNGYIVGDGDTPRSHTQLTLLDPRSTTVHRVESGPEFFYGTAGLFAELGDIKGRVMIPNRYVAHFRLFTPNDPLVGVTPVNYAAQSIAANNAITSHQAAFFSNMSRPSGALVTEAKLTAEQATQLRKSWEDQSKGLNSGNVPILTNGLNWQPLSITSQDAELVSAWRMTVEEVSRVFRIPPMLINNMENATFNNAEALMGFWLSSGLGFLISALEQTWMMFFNLPNDEIIQYDTEVLLRSDLETRIKSYGEGVTKGLYAPNEGRGKLGLPPKPGGDMPRVQQQMIPLDVDPTALSAQPTPSEEPEPEDEEEEEEVSTEEVEAAAQAIIGKGW